MSTCGGGDHYYAVERFNEWIVRVGPSCECGAIRLSVDVVTQKITGKAWVLNLSPEAEATT